MKRRKDVNQGGHLRGFKLCICLNRIGVSSKITSPASYLCKLQMVCRKLKELTPYVHYMAPADGLFGVQVLMSSLQCMVKAFLSRFLFLKSLGTKIRSVLGIGTETEEGESFG